MIRLIKKLAVLVVLLWALPSCGSDDQAKGPMPAGTLSVNGTSVNGSVEAGNVRIYTLLGTAPSNTYRVRTVIAPGGTLFASVYSDFFSYKAGAAPIAFSVALVPNNYYEVSFRAAQNIDPVVVLRGAPSNPNYSSVYFYGLRLMSASAPLLSQWTNTTIVSGLTATAAGTINPDTLRVYSGETITPSGTYSILLTSSTLTLSYPQVFIYKDSSLSLASLMFSIVTATTGSEFSISDFTSNPTVSTFPSTAPTITTSSIVSGVTFTNGTGGGPFILLKGVSKATYTLTVGPP